MPVAWPHPWELLPTHSWVTVTGVFLWALDLDVVKDEGNYMCQGSRVDKAAADLLCRKHRGSEQKSVAQIRGHLLNAPNTSKQSHLSPSNPNPRRDCRELVPETNSLTHKSENPPKKSRRNVLKFILRSLELEVH